MSVAEAKRRASRRTRATTHRRFDAVFIRKSGSQQENRAQIANVKQMLEDKGIHVADEHWFICTVPRANVSGNVHFKRLLDLVEADKLGTVYVESQDRFGTDDVTEFFTVLHLLRVHGARLYDLRDKIDLTRKDDATLMKAFLGSMKSTKERKDTAYRSMRSKIENFKATASWPTGTQPFGFGKRCCSANGIVTHEEAERILLDKVKEVGLEYDELKSAMARGSMDEQLQYLRRELTLDLGRWVDLVDDGVVALEEYYNDNYRVKPKALEAFREQAIQFYSASETDRGRYTKRLQDMSAKVEKACVDKAKAKLAQLRKDHEKWTERWADASDMQRTVLKKKCDELEAEVALWEPRTKTISQRLSDLDEVRRDIVAKQKELLEELPHMEGREKGEALRRLFKTVTLYWDQEFVPKSKEPSRPLKTNRPGRNRFTLRKDKIGWEFSAITLPCSS